MDKSEEKKINFVRCLKCGKILKCSRYDTAVLLKHIRSDHPEVFIVDTDKTKFVPETEETEPPQTPDATKTNMGCTCIGSGKKSDDNYSEGQETKDTEDTKHTENTEDGEEDEVREKDFNINAQKEDKKMEPQLVKDIDLTQYSVTSEILEKYPEIKDCEYCPRNPNASVVYTRRYKVYTPTPVSFSTIETAQKCKLYRTSIEKWRPANGSLYCPKCGRRRRPLIRTQAERFTNNELGACCLLSCWPFCFFPWLIPGQNLEHLHCSNCKNFLGLYDRNKNCIRPNSLFAKETPKTDADVSSDSSVKESISAIKNSNNSGKVSFKQNYPPPATPKSPRSPSIVIDGKELHPDMVARLQKFKKYSSLAGIDLDAVIDKESPDVSNSGAVHRETVNAAYKTPPVGKTSNVNDKSNI